MKNVDIINVAGLLMDGSNDGLERAIREHLDPRSITTIAPTPPSSAREHPEKSIDRAESMISECIEDLEKRYENSCVVIVARSYAGYIALKVSIRMQFTRIVKVVITEAPIHPFVHVTPPVAIPPLLACRPHYNERARGARQAMEALETLGTSKLVIIQGGSRDDIVPNEAQIIPGDFEIIRLAEYAPWNIQIAETKGTIITLPSRIGGRADGLKKVLGPGYRNHLFWSPEKMALVEQVIGATGHRAVETRDYVSAA